VKKETVKIMVKMFAEIREGSPDIFSAAKKSSTEVFHGKIQTSFKKFLR
jgi:hypothetical protein